MAAPPPGRAPGPAADRAHAQRRAVHPGPRGPVHRSRPAHLRLRPVRGDRRAVHRRGPVPDAGDKVSIGDYVLAGGEAAVLVMVEAISRLLPGVLGNERSASDDSFGGRAAGEMGSRPSPRRAVRSCPTSAGSAAAVATRRPAGRAAGGPGLHSAPGLAGPGGAGRAVVRGPRGHRPLAPGRGPPATAANRPDLIFRAQADPAALSDRDWQLLTPMGDHGIRSAEPVRGNPLASGLVP